MRKIVAYLGFYLDLRDNLGIISDVFGHEKTIGNGLRWLGSIVFTQTGLQVTAVTKP